MLMSSVRDPNKGGDLSSELLIKEFSCVFFPTLTNKDQSLWNVDNRIPCSYSIIATLVTN